MGEAAAEKRTSSLDAFRAVFHNPGLRRLQLAWAGSNLGTWGFLLALAVFAYDHGGVTAVAVVGIVRMVPAAIAAPFMGVLGDRHSRRLVMVASDLSRVILVGLAAVAIVLKVNPVIVYALATLAVATTTAFRPAQAAIIPGLASTPQELTASNVVSSSIESVGMFAGPAVAGVVLAVAGTAAAFLVATATFLWSALLILLIHEPPRPAQEPKNEDDHEERPSFFQQSLGGFGTVAKEPGPRLLVGLFGAQSLVNGAVNVLEIVIAFQLLGRGAAWVGVLAASFGVGAIVGAVIAGALVGRGRLAVDFGAGVLLWGMPLLLIALWPKPGVAIAAEALMGVGNTLVDVSGFTLLQRSVPDDVLARVFGVLETVFFTGVALGTIITPVLINGLGVRPTLLAVGVFLPIVIAVSGRRLLALDASLHAPERELAILRGISFFAPLPLPVQEHLAGRLVSSLVDGGTEIFDQGAPGDRFYIVAEGAVEILKDGVLIAEIPPGGYFGEIALLHDVPRQAAARALRDTELLALEGEDFVAAVTGHANSLEAAEAVVRGYGPGIGIRN